jgi:hypothetical protein
MEGKNQLKENNENKNLHRLKEHHYLNVLPGY